MVPRTPYSSWIVVGSGVSTSWESREAMRTIEEDIIDWVGMRPVWQRNLIKRLARDEVVDDAYIAQIASEMIAGNSTLEVGVMQELVTVSV